MKTFQQFRILLEYDRSKAAQALGKRFLATIERDRATKGQTPLQVLEKIEQADPTPNHQYIQWLIRAFQNGSKLEDLLSRGKQNLIKFAELTKRKRLSPTDRDISRFPDLKELEYRMLSYEDARPKLINKGHYKEVLNNDEMRVIRIDDEEAAKYYGQGTRWCTAADQHNMFNEYHERGSIFVILPKHPKYSGEKFQWHFQSDQYMNEEDDEINLQKFRQRFPKSAYALFKLATFDSRMTDSGDEYFDYWHRPQWINMEENQNFWPVHWKESLEDGSITPKEALSYAFHMKRNKMKQDPRIPKILLQSKEPALLEMYSTQIMGEPWVEAEPYILSDRMIKAVYINKFAVTHPQHILDILGLEDDESRLMDGWNRPDTLGTEKRKQ